MVHAECLIVAQNLVLDGLLVADEETVAGEILQGAVGALRGVEAEGVMAGSATAATQIGGPGFCAGFRLVPCPAIV